MDDAVRENRMDVARYLKERGAQYQVDANVAGSLCEAAFSGDLEGLKLLLEVVCVDPNTSDYDRRTALHLAASEGHVEVVDLLTSLPNINLSPRDRLGNTPLDDAMRHRRNEARRHLQSKGAQMGDQQVGVTLCSLGATNETERIKELAECGIPISEGDYDARTALHLAASEGKLQAATFLLNEANVDPNPLDRFLYTPLDDAMRHNQRAMQSLLRENGGLRGEDRRMKEKVELFKKQQEENRALKATERIEREMRGTAIHSLTKDLRRLREHPTLLEDAEYFTNHSRNLRALLLRLLKQSAQDEFQKNDDPDDEAQQDITNAKGTKEHFEHLLELAVSGLDASAARLLAVLEAEVLPWCSGLSKAETKLVRLFLPNLKETIQRLREQLQTRSQLTRMVKKCWGDHGNGAAYSCIPLGLLAMQRIGEKFNTNVHEAQLDALSALWAATPAATLDERWDPTSGSQLRSKNGAHANEKDKPKNRQTVAYMQPSMALSNLIGWNERS
jgi:hypothetical protein